ncbi:MAG: hypothetical protein JXA43_00220 [Candidatus Diapherotrites archaeon]|nr:hypothetical protein [Candidatus Diapherotrites archaeon]
MPRPRPSGGADYLTNLASQVSTISASLSVIEQKLTHIGRNEQILNKNIISLNNKMKEIEKKVHEAGGGDGISPEMMEQINQVMQELRAQLDDMRAQLEAISSQGVSAGLSDDDIRKLKYIVETIDPLKFVTVDQVERIIDEKLSR